MINDNIYKNPIQNTSNLNNSNTYQTNNKMPNHNYHHQFPLFVDEETTSSLDISSVQNNEDLNDDFSEFIDIPNLVSDDESWEEDSVLTNTFRSLWKTPGCATPATTAHSSFDGNIPQPTPSQQQPLQPQQQQQQAQPASTEKEVFTTTKVKVPILHTQRIQPAKRVHAKQQRRAGARVQPKELTVSRKLQERVNKSNDSKSTAVATISKLSPEQFKNERTQLMTIIVKYMATKIYNSFPPESPRQMKPNEVPLDKFLLLLTCRLQLTLPLFMKGIIYLFRYMDIIYLLRYLNQSNNFINYKDMGFELKKLIVGCFKLAILKERRIHKDKYNYNWHHITGLNNHEINSIVKQIVSRMNGKLNIKEVELGKMKSELFRFVKMVSKEV